MHPEKFCPLKLCVFKIHTKLDTMNLQSRKGLQLVVNDPHGGCIRKPQLYLVPLCLILSVNAT